MRRESPHVTFDCPGIHSRSHMNSADIYVRHGHILAATRSSLGLAIKPAVLSDYSAAKTIISTLMSLRPFTHTVVFQLHSPKPVAKWIQDEIYVGKLNILLKFD